jgi:hypothetical protein
VLLSRVARAALTRLVQRTGSNSFLSDFLGHFSVLLVLSVSRWRSPCSRFSRTSWPAYCCR